MSQNEARKIRALAIIAVAMSGLIGCAHSPSTHTNRNLKLPNAKISKLPKRAPASNEPMIERLIVGTTQPTVGQRITYETTIVNRDHRTVEVTENVMGTERKHILNPGEMMSATYDYNRLLRSNVIAEYSVKPAGSELVSKISLSENSNGFGCKSLGTWCKVMPLTGRGLPNFRFSIPLGSQTYVGSNEPQ